MEYKAKVLWRLGDGELFTDNKYSRGHKWVFDGIEIPASSSPSVVPLPYSLVGAIDPEEALVASVSSCHMLWVLSIASKRKFRVLSYTDDALGFMSLGQNNKMFISKIVLRPHLVFAEEHLPTVEDVAILHDLAHQECFIANSILSEILIETQLAL
jgi:organic hydroperoxide reductase OsmC/OhrA